MALHQFLWKTRAFGAKPGIEQGGTAALGELLAALSTVQQADTVAPIHFLDNEIIRPGVAKQLAFGIGTGESVQVGSLPEALLEHSWLLSQELHRARHWLSTPLR